MRAENDKILIGKLTTEAEQGHGCFVKSALSELGFEERFRVLNEIDSLNAKHRLVDSSVHRIELTHWTGPAYIWENTKTELELNDDTNSAILKGPRLYKYSLDLQTGRHIDSCADLESPQK